MKLLKQTLLTVVLIIAAGGYSQPIAFPGAEG